MKFKKDEIVLLLGAGCSVEAGIPSSSMMINDIEALISGEKKDDNTKVDWESYGKIYSHIKSSIIYGFGLNKKFGEKANYNIEKLVDTLSELEKMEGHSLYPFINEWDRKLIKHAGQDFEKIKEMKKVIVDKLQKWVTVDNYDEARYYSGLVEFRKAYTYPLRVFSLNYDLCLEKHIGNAQLETGFENRKWTWRKFEEIPDISTTDIYLYKMHGSINWVRDEEDNLTYSDEVVKISHPELIFGTSYKMQYIDPYLFFATEFRKYTIESRLIIAIGYGFGDEHINGMLRQAIRSDPKIKILCVLLNGDKKHIHKELNPKRDDQIIIEGMKAKQFIEQELAIDKLEELFPSEEGIFPG